MPSSPNTRTRTTPEAEASGVVPDEVTSTCLEVVIDTGYGHGPEHSLRTACTGTSWHSSDRAVTLPALTPIQGRVVAGTEKHERPGLAAGAFVVCR